MVLCVEDRIHACPPGLPHGAKRRDGLRRPASLEQLPVGRELALVQLRPRLDQAPLPSREVARDQSDRIDSEDGDNILIVGMEVSSMVPPTDLDEHADDHPPNYFPKRLSVW